MILLLLFLMACFLAYSNGANDNFKGVATLFGSSTTSFTSAIRWATITTLLGSLTAIFLASVLVQNFSGKGLVPDELLQGPAFAMAVAFGAALTVFIATRVGMPVSTTHGLVGALFGAGVMAIGSAFNFSKLGSAFLVPLLVSPLMAAALSLLAYLTFRKARQKLGYTKTSCVCVGQEILPVALEVGEVGGNRLYASAATSLRIGETTDCQEVYQGSFLGVRMQRLLDSGHFLSAGVVSFSRGLNDTPKIAGLLLVVHSFQVQWGIAAVAVAMAVGGLLNARRVGMTMSKKITRMNHGQGFTANLITGLLVTTASVHGMPVSTTHVSVGSIFGIGAVTRQVNYRVVSNILLSWVLTLPTAAACAAAAYWLLANFV